MEKFLNQLYSYEYFGIYLIISIIILVLLFIIILFFGKKDKKEREIEATKKLLQINDENAFKEDSIEEKLEIGNINSENLENDTLIMSSIEDVPSINTISENEIPDPVLPVQEEVKEEIIEPVIESPVVEPIITEKKTEESNKIETNSPILSKVEEKPLIFNELNIDSDLKEDIKPVETPVVETDEIEVPTFNFDEIVKDVEQTKKEQTYTKGPQIFSSVYVPEKEEIELPKESEEVKIDSDLDFELPSLKKEVATEEEKNEKQEEKIEMPVLNDYNLDNLSGETYTIK